MDPECITSNPPPAYSEQEFDQKISRATTLSLHLSRASLAVDPDGWPQYDPAAFEAAEGSSTSPSTAERSSSGKMDDYKQHGRTVDLPSVVPLRIEKKNQPNPLPNPAAQSKKESSSLTIGENSTPTLFSSESSNHDDFRTQYHSAQNPYAEDTVSLMPLIPVQHSTQISHKRDTSQSLPPPPFDIEPLAPVQHSTQIAHKRDASQILPPPPPPPPFEIESPFAPVQHSTQIAHKRDASLSLPPPPFEIEPPTSIPESRTIVYDHDNHYQQYVSPYNITPSQSARQLQSRSRLVPQERPGASYSSAPNTIQPSYLDFNPSIAYGRPQPAAPSRPSPPPTQPVRNLQFDPHSFYNSAVSAQITPVTTGQQGHSSYSSYNSHNSFSPQRQYQQQGSSETYLRPGGRYNQSYVSQDSLSTGRSSAPFELNSPHRPVLQPPARPSSFSVSTNYQLFNTPPSPVFQYVDHTANIPGNIYYDQSPENRWTTQ